MLDVSKLKPVSDYVIYRRDPPGGQIGSILIPSTQYHESFYAQVVAVGEGKILSNGKRSPMSVKVGDRILISQHDRDCVDETNDPYLQIAREGQILAIVEDIGEKNEIST